MASHTEFLTVPQAEFSQHCTALAPRLRRASALPLAYAQMSSMRQLRLFERLERLHSSTTQPPPVAALPETLDGFLENLKHIVNMRRPSEFLGTMTPRRVSSFAIRRGRSGFLFVWAKLIAPQATAHMSIKMTAGTLVELSYHTTAKPLVLLLRRGPLAPAEACS
jgi:hypothetical protein